MRTRKRAKRTERTLRRSICRSATQAGEVFRSACAVVTVVTSSLITLPIRLPSTRRLSTESCSCHRQHHLFCRVLGKTGLLSHGKLCFLYDGAQMFREPIPEPASSFACVRQSYNVKEVTSRTRESLSYRSRSAWGVNLG